VNNNSQLKKRRWEMNKKDYNPKIREITSELIYNHHMEMVEEAWKLFNWARNEKLKKQEKLADF
jgi:hypothetical protein